MISEGASRLSKHISNKIQIRKLTSNAHNNKKIVNNLGIEFSFNKNGRSISSFTKAIKSANWTSKMVMDYFTSNFSSGVASLLMGLM